MKVSLVKVAWEKKVDVGLSGGSFSESSIVGLGIITSISFSFGMYFVSLSVMMVVSAHQPSSWT
jgi:hypothetical protein